MMDAGPVGVHPEPGAGGRRIMTPPRPVAPRRAVGNRRARDQAVTRAPTAIRKATAPRSSGTHRDHPPGTGRAANARSRAGDRAENARHRAGAARSTPHLVAPDRITAPLTRAVVTAGARRP